MALWIGSLALKGCPWFTPHPISDVSFFKFQLTPSGQPIKVEDQKPNPGSLPKFQYTFGAQNPANTVVKTEPGLVVVKSEPGLEPSPNPKLVLTSAQNCSPQQKAASSVLSKLGQLQPTSQIVVSGGIGTATLQNSSQVTLQTTASPSAASHADLIRQLNLARAQGLVVLQQWGDKQVNSSHFRHPKTVRFWNVRIFFENKI